MDASSADTQKSSTDVKRRRGPKGNDFCKVKPRPNKQGMSKGKYKQPEAEEEQQSMKEYIKNQSHEIFVKSIPLESIKELPDEYMFKFGFVAIAIVVALFAFFSYSALNSTLQNKYLSLTAIGKLCQNISTTVNLESKLGTLSGYWQGSKNFVNTESIYSLNLDNYKGTSEDFLDLMQRFGDLLKPYSVMASQQVLSYNLLLWASIYLEVIVNDEIQSLEMTGSPAAMFEAELVTAGFANHLGVCDSILDASFDTSKAIFTVDVSKSLLSQQCGFLTGTSFFSYSNVSRKSEISLYIDSEALVTALSVGFKYLDVKVLNPLVYDNQQPFINYNNEFGFFKVTRYVNPRYADMDPILCSTRNGDNGNPFCFLYFAENIKHGAGKGYGVPILLNAGSNPLTPSKCDCSEYAMAPLCNILYLYAGVILFNNIEDIFYMQQNYSQFTFNEASYNAAYISMSGELPTAVQKTIVTKAFVKQSFSFCNVRNCSALFWKEYSNLTQKITPQYYQLFNGSCRDSLSTPYFDHLAAVPPIDLNENYFECSDNFSDAFLAAVGIAQGNVSAAAPFILAMLLPLIYLYLKAIGYVPPKIEYTHEETQVTLNELALQITRARDGKTRAMKRDGLIVNLAKELLKSAQIPGGYPDSDDEDDDDDNDVGGDNTMNNRSTHDDEENGRQKNKPAPFRYRERHAERDSTANFNGTYELTSIQNIKNSQNLDDDMSSIKLQSQPIDNRHSLSNNSLSRNSSFRNDQSRVDVTSMNQNRRISTESSRDLKPVPDSSKKDDSDDEDNFDGKSNLDNRLTTSNRLSQIGSSGATPQHKSVRVEDLFRGQPTDAGGGSDISNPMFDQNSR